MRQFELSGHRGARGLWPENTLTGFAGAARLGVDALEFDVVMTADGVAVVNHDLRLDPDLARGPDGAWIPEPGPAIRALSVAELGDFDIGRARPGGRVAADHPRQAAVDGEHVPRLAEVFRLLAGYPALRLEVELKTDPLETDLSPDPADLAEAVMHAANEAGVDQRVALRSFDWRGLSYAAARWPHLPLAFLTEDATAQVLGEVRDAAAGRPADWAPEHAHLTPDLIQAAQQGGILVKPWTVNHRRDMARLIAWGVDGFCTDDPDVARRVMAEAGLALPQALPAG